MTYDEKPSQPAPYNPASMPTSSLSTLKAVWYKRPWFLATAAAVIIIVVSVIADLPHPITKAQDAAAQNSSIRQINTDTAPCGFAVKEAFSFYTKDVGGNLTPSNQAQAITLLVGDQTACSFASGGLSDLTNNFQPLDTTAGKHIDAMASVVQQWMTDYALAAIEDIQYLFVHPGDQAKISNLTTQQVHLAAERQRALNDLKSAETILATTLVQVNVPILNQLPGT
jgi:hypothetical protein